MFNIKKGLLSLTISCTETSLSLFFAPDDRSTLTRLSGTLIGTHRALIESYVMLHPSPEPEVMLMEYYQRQGYEVTKLLESVQQHPARPMGIQVLVANSNEENEASAHP